jgi:hypothetical protein
LIRFGVRRLGVSPVRYSQLQGPGVTPGVVVGNSGRPDRKTGSRTRLRESGATGQPSPSETITTYIHLPANLSVLQPPELDNDM